MSHEDLDIDDQYPDFEEEDLTKRVAYCHECGCDTNQEIEGEGDGELERVEEYWICKRCGHKVERL